MTEDTQLTPPGIKPLRAHSLAEIHLYLMVRSCKTCAAGPLRGAATVKEPRGEHSLVTVQAKCSSCNEESYLLFEIPGESAGGGAESGRGSRINPCGEESSILDVVQWVTLARIMREAADRAADRCEARELRCDAGECLDEALRFYDPQSELPPGSGLFAEHSKQRIKDRPELYIRQALIGARGKLPARRPVVRESGRGRRSGGSWWRRWWRAG